MPYESSEAGVLYPLQMWNENYVSGHYRIGWTLFTQWPLQFVLVDDSEVYLWRKRWLSVTPTQQRSHRQKYRHRKSFPWMKLTRQTPHVVVPLILAAVVGDGFFRGLRSAHWRFWPISASQLPQLPPCQLSRIPAVVLIFNIAAVEIWSLRWQCWDFAHSVSKRGLKRSGAVLLTVTMYGACGCC